MCGAMRGGPFPRMRGAPASANHQSSVAVASTYGGAPHAHPSTPHHTLPIYVRSSGASGLPCGVPPRHGIGCGQIRSICGGRQTRAEGTPARPRSALAARKRAVRRQGSTQPAWLSACEHEIWSGLALVSGRGSFGSQELFKRAVSMQARSGGQAHRKNTSACTLRRHPCRGTLERPASKPSGSN